MSNHVDLQKLERIESLAREAIRTAISEVAGTTSSGRALEALKEFRNAADPQTVLDLILAFHATREPVT